ncbi:MAG: sigma-54 dependent transcriptional regulator [Candidatus Sulfomarinibacteraceae bacterium]
MLCRTLLVTETPTQSRRLRRMLDDEFIIEEAKDADGMWSALARDAFDLLLLDRDALPGDTVDVVAELRQLPQGPEIIVLQPEENAVERARLLTAGALAALNDRLDDTMLASTVAAVVGRQLAPGGRTVEDATGLSRFEDFASNSTAMRELLDVADRVSRSDASLLVLGETGVGKEWLARAIHNAGSRATGPFIAVNCAAVPENLLESELFGHEKGAFTGAVRAHRGHFEMAHRGTLFLDEIADMPVHLQSKLLRVLQERRIQRLGAEKTLAVDVRVMAATNRDLERTIKERTFREDLYYRLSVVALEVPPLRRRREDIAPLVHGYLERFALQLGRSGMQIRQDALESLEAYDWPGNVRELINVMERAVLLCTGTVITPTDLPGAVARAAGHAFPRPPADDDEDDGDATITFPESWLGLPLPDFRRRVGDATEVHYLSSLLERTDGRVGDAAEAAGIDPRSLYDRLRRLGIRKEDFRRRRIKG